MTTPLPGPVRRLQVVASAAMLLLLLLLLLLVGMSPPSCHAWTVQQVPPPPTGTWAADRPGRYNADRRSQHPNHHQRQHHQQQQPRGFASTLRLSQSPGSSPSSSPSSAAVVVTGTGGAAADVVGTGTYPPPTAPRDSDHGLISPLARRNSESRRRPHTKENQDQWDRHFRQLVAFKGEFGHTDVPMKYVAQSLEREGPPSPCYLAKWLKRQQRDYRIFVKSDGLRGAMRADRFDALTSVGIRLVEHQRDRRVEFELSWEKQFQRLLEFRQKHGHVNVPKKNTEKKNQEDHSLADWVVSQREHYRRQKDPTVRNSGRITQDRIQQLDAVGFDWTASYVQEEHDKQWDERFHELVAFRNLYNTTKIPKSMFKDHWLIELMEWAQSQRQNYRWTVKNATSFHAKVLTPNRRVRLDSIGFTNSSKPITDDDEWLTRYWRAEYIHHKYGQGDGIPLGPSDYYQTVKGLSKWAVKQQATYRAGLLTPWRIDLLNRIDFDFHNPVPLPPQKSYNSEWKRKYRIYSKLCKTYRTTFLFRMDKGGEDWLKLWIITQRVQLGRFSNITDEVELLDAVMEHFNYSSTTESHTGVTPRDLVDRIHCLNSLGFVWDASFAYWLEMYERYVASLQVHNVTSIGEMLILDGSDEDSELTNWKGTQRQFHTNGELAKERVDLLNAVNFAWDPRLTIWMEKFKLYGEHIDSDPANLPANLRQWATIQRNFYSDGKLEPERMVRLESISGWSWHAFQTKWVAMYDRLTAYVEEHGNAAVPTIYARDQELAYWVKNQRDTFRNREMLQDRIELLSLLDFFYDVD